jgi:hypothetical protein
VSRRSPLPVPPGFGAAVRAGSCFLSSLTWALRDSNIEPIYTAFDVQSGTCLGFAEVLNALKYGRHTAATDRLVRLLSEISSERQLLTRWRLLMYHLRQLRIGPAAVTHSAISDQ